MLMLRDLGRPLSVVGVPLRLLLNPNHTHSNRSAFPLREFQTRLLRCCFRLEWLRQRRELTIDILEEQPLLDDFGALNFIAREQDRLLCVG